MSNGNRLPLGPGLSELSGSTSAVTVSSVSQSGFTFNTVQGEHPFYPGMITFSASDAGNGQIAFSVNVNADFSGARAVIGYYLLGGNTFENSVWENLINSVQTACQK